MAALSMIVHQFIRYMAWLRVRLRNPIPNRNPSPTVLQTLFTIMLLWDVVVNNVEVFDERRLFCCLWQICLDGKIRQAAAELISTSKRFVSVGF